MTYKLDLTINATHPNEAISTLEDLLYFIDDIASMFSSKHSIEKDDIPIYLTYQGESSKDSLTTTPLPSKLTLVKLHTSPELRFCPRNPSHQIGDKVRHSFDGVEYTIKAHAYYHISRTYTYLITDGLDITRISQGPELISKHLFEQMPTMLYNVTGKNWTWNTAICMFQCHGSPSRRMRPKDVLATWKQDFEKTEVPF
jgi:hypothetical protein